MHERQVFKMTTREIRQTWSHEGNKRKRTQLSWTNYEAQETRIGDQSNQVCGEDDQ